MEVRIKPTHRGADGWVFDDDITITKTNWTTVTKSQGKKLLALQHRGVLLMESRETETDEVEVEEPEEDTTLGIDERINPHAKK